jgi:hypothetical protein
MKTKKLSSILVLVAIIATLALAACPLPEDDPDGVETFTSISDFETWIDSQTENTPNSAYNIKMKIDSLGGISNNSNLYGSLGYVLYHKRNIYINLDLSDSTFTSIGAAAFSGCTSLISVIISDCVISIGNSAFSSCSSLTSINIPNSVISISDSAFRHCTSLTSINIPNSVTEIGYYAFEDCTSLTSVTIPNRVTIIKGETFQGCNRLTSVTIPDSVTKIESNAFDSCESLTSITIPNSVTGIGMVAFGNCISLTSVTFQGTIPSSGFASTAFNATGYVNIGDLRDKFYATDSTNGTPGTYTRPADSTTWTKSS